MKEYTPVKEGKVREIYDIGDCLIMVATDRISAFDVILKNKITKKGTVLTQMSRFWFDYTKDILPNHMISTDVCDMPEFFRQDRFRNALSCPSPSTPPAPRLRSATTTRTSALSGALRFWKNSSPARDRNMLKRSGTARSPFTKNALNMPRAAALS